MVKADQREDVKEDPRSEVMWRGTPNQEIHDERRAEAQDEASAVFNGIASGQRVDLSMIVMRYR